MATDRRQRVQRLFEAALACDPSERRAFLQGAFALDPSLRKEVGSLIASHEDSDSFIEVLPKEELKALSLDMASLTPARDNQTDSAERQQIGPYRILSEIGHGGMGVVYQAEQERPVHRRVALKLIKWGMDTKAVIARFESERQALALMNHPNIASVYDAGASDQGRPYFSMELVRGEPITQYCDKNRLTIKGRLGLFIQICDGVQHAHQKGIIHRDIKPSNILVTIQDGKPVPKIIDFGVAKATSQRLTERTVYTELGELIGTPEYMSPEQAEMTGIDIDTRTDVYSLGVLLYELLVGAQPFEAKMLREASFDDMRRRIREEEPPKPSTRLSRLGEPSTTAANNRGVELRSLERELRGDLDWITMKALEKDRTRRYGSPADLAADLERHLRHEPVLASPPSTGYRLRKFVSRHRWGVTVAGVLVALLVAGTAVSTWQAIRAMRAERRALLEAQAAERVSEFLSNLFNVSEPTEARGNTVTARELLDKGAEQIDSELRDQPELQARLMHIMGRVYESLGLYDQGEVLLERALTTRKGVLGNEHADTLASAHSLGILYRSQGRYDEAERLYTETLEAKRRVLGDDHPDTLATMNNLAALYVTQGRNEEAETLHEQTLAARRRVLGDEHRETLQSIHNLAGVYWGRRRSDEAEALFQEVLQTQRRVLGDDHPDTLVSMKSLAILYLNAGRYDEAEPLFLEVLEAQEHVLGDDHPATLESRHHVALLYEYQGRYEKSEALYLDIIEAKRRTLGDDHPDTLFSMYSLAGLYQEVGRYDQAEALHLETLEARKRVLGEEHPDMFFSMQGLSNLYRDRGRYDEAEAFYRETIKGQRRLLGEDHPATVYTIYSLACLHALRDEREKALECLSKAVEAGYSNADAMAEDSNLESLRGDPEFEAIVDRIRRKAR